MKKYHFDKFNKGILFMVLFFFCCTFSPVDALADSVNVVIDPGHGGDPKVEEANGGASYNGIYEKDLNLVVAKAMAEELNTYKGVNVAMTRTDDHEMDLQERCNAAAAVNADVMISIHFNAAEEHLFYGSEVWVSAFDQYYATGYGLGTCFMQEFREAGLCDRGIKTRIGKAGTDYYGVIRHGRELGIPVIIVEHCYVDSIEDANRYDSKEKLINFGIRDARAVAQYYGLNKESAPEKIEPTVLVPVVDSPILPDETEPQEVTVELLSIQDGISVKMHAVDPESDILYYGYSFDGGSTFSRLFEWDKVETGEATAQAVLPMPADGSRPESVQIEVYNNRNKKALSNIVYITQEDDEAEKVQSNEEGTVGVEGKYDLEDVYDYSALLDVAEKSEQGGTNGKNGEKNSLDGKENKGQTSYEILLAVMFLVTAIMLGVVIALVLVLHFRRKCAKKHR